MWRLDKPNSPPRTSAARPNNNSQARLAHQTALPLLHISITGWRQQLENAVLVLLSFSRPSLLSPARFCARTCEIVSEHATGAAASTGRSGTFAAAMFTTEKLQGEGFGAVETRALDGEP